SHGETRPRPTAQVAARGRSDDGAGRPASPVSAGEVLQGDGVVLFGLSGAAGFVLFGDCLHGFGDGGVQCAVEDAGHAVGGVEFLGGHHIGHGVGGGDEYVIGDPRGAGIEESAEHPGGGQHVVDLVGEVAAPGGHHGGVAGGDDRV